MANKKNLYIMAEIKNIVEKTGKPVVEVIDAYIKKNGSNKYLENMKKLYVQKEKTEIWDKIQTDIENAIVDGEQGTEIEIIEKLMIDIREGNTDYGLDDKGKNEILKKMQSRINNIKSEEQKEAVRKEAERIAAEEEARKEAERIAAEEEARKEAERIAAEEETRKKAERIAAEEQAKKEKPEISEKTKQAIEEIEKIAERELGKGNIDSRAKYLRSVRNMIIGEYEQSVFKVNIEDSERDELLEVLDGKIKDEVYFEQVQAFTNNFEFLRENTDVIDGAAGTRRRNRFTDKEAHDRFCSLRETLQTKFKDEYSGVKSLIKNKGTDKIDVRILKARMEVLRREYERRIARGEVR